MKQLETVYLDEELKKVINSQWEARKNNRVMLPYVFLNEKGDNKIERFDKTWNTACIKAKIGKQIFHERYNIPNEADLIEASRMKGGTYLTTRDYAGCDGT